MRKTKDWEWNIIAEPNGSYGIDQAQLSVLMDIRSELKKLNSLLHCSSFIAIPRHLAKIQLNTKKNRKKR